MIKVFVGEGWCLQAAAENAQEAFEVWQEETNAVVLMLTTTATACKEDDGPATLYSLALTVLYN